MKPNPSKHSAEGNDLQSGDTEINRFAFVVHPLDIGFIHQHKWFRWTRYFPDALIETIGAWFPPLYLSRIRGGISPTTGQRIEGYLYTLGATPRQMLKRGARHTYLRLNLVARMAERRGARIMGLGAFTSVVGDAGITVAREANIAITSGNSLTVVTTLEAAKGAIAAMGHTDLAEARAMVIGATGAIGSVCARLLAQAVREVVLISLESEKLMSLQRLILEESPGANVVIGTRTEDLIGECDLIITATSAFGRRVMDITYCKPGAVVCDVARPPDIAPAEADLRPDVLVIESGQVLIPGDIDIGYDIGLPPKTVYACLAETALLAMEGRFEDYTLGRTISLEKVEEIYQLFKKHNFHLAGLTSYGHFVTTEDLAKKRLLADSLRNDPEHFEQFRADAAAKLARLPATAKGVPEDKPGSWSWLGLIAGVSMIGLWLRRRRQRR